MKNFFLFAAIAATMAAFSACSDKNADSNGSNDKESLSDDAVYTGVLPSADADGIRYTMFLDFDDDDNDGEYEMVQTYFNNDTTGITDIASFVSEGKFTVTQGDNGVKNLKFTGPQNDEMYFVVATDSTLVMTDASFVPADTNLNYTLKKIK